MSVTRDVTQINMFTLKIWYGYQKKLQSLGFAIISMVKLCDPPMDV